MTPNGPDRTIYERRRRTFLERLDKAVVFLPETPEAVYSNDVHYRYRPDTNIRYLCGFEEPAAMIVSRCGEEEDGFTLCVTPKDPAAETWTGPRVGPEGVRTTYGIDHAHSIDETFEVLEQRLQKADRLWYGYHRDATVNARVLEIVHRVNGARQRSGRCRVVIAEAQEILGEMRLVKQVEEIAILRQACSISVAAHRRAMEEVVPGGHESRVAALVEYLMRDAGCDGPAYGTIAASGENATTLHYVRNENTLTDGDLILLDAGGEYGGYCADITRTFPVGTSYSSAQAALYDIVLAAQHAAIETVTPEATHEQVHHAALNVLVDGMIEIGLLEGPAGDCIEQETYKNYYMHGTSHWLGMDVHDTGRYRVDGASRVLEPGMVLTVEPGIYVRADSQAPERLRGIGIRIEDDVLVTTGGHDVLTADLPKRRAEIETLRRRALATFG